MAVSYAQQILTAMQQNRSLVEDAKDFTEDDVVLLKEMLLSLEQVIDDITISNADDGETRPGAYIFEFLAQANVSEIPETGFSKSSGSTNRIQSKYV